MVTRDGEDYIRVNKFNMDTNPENLTINLENLFAGDTKLGQCYECLMNFEMTHLAQISPRYPWDVH